MERWQLPQWGQLREGETHHTIGGAQRSRGRNHLLLRRLLSSLGGPGSTTVTLVGLGRGSRLGNELHAVALVGACLTVGIDLTSVVVVDARTCHHAVVGGVVCAQICGCAQIAPGCASISGHNRRAYTWINITSAM